MTNLPDGSPPLEHSQRNNDRLLELKDRFEGRRAFLIGNGPSLKMQDLDRLHAGEEICFASNRIYLAYDLTPWRPTFYSICDEVVARNNREKILALPPVSIKVFANSVRKYLWNDPSATFVNPRSSHDERPPDFQGWDLLRGENAGHSVLNLSIKVAYWVGIREMYIIGADHHFIVPDTKTGERIMNNDVIVGTGEVNHFHPDYRPKGETWTVPQLDQIERDFAESKRIIEAAGGIVRNASRFSKLEVFERVDFDSL